MMRYQGKNAFWFIAIVIFYNLYPIVLFFQFENITVLKMLFVVIWYLFDFVMLPILFVNYVELYEDSFVFHYGFSKQKIYLNEITKIEKSHNVIASSANSLDRIHIETKNHEMYISLVNNDKFIEEVRSRR